MNSIPKFDAWHCMHMECYDNLKPTNFDNITASNNNYRTEEYHMVNTVCIPLVIELLCCCLLLSSGYSHGSNRLNGSCHRLLRELQNPGELKLNCIVPS